MDKLILSLSADRRSVSMDHRWPLYRGKAAMARSEESGSFAPLVEHDNNRNNHCRSLRPDLISFCILLYVTTQLNSTQCAVTWEKEHAAVRVIRLSVRSLL